jgi:hypothetical protein
MEGWHIGIIVWLAVLALIVIGFRATKDDRDDGDYRDLFLSGCPAPGAA